ncbi:MAG: AAA family ATPase [Candidatus Methanomethyliaceae archaeon]|nr:AAA family ATPase [Candidatus Methanomethyliaceae archaeon]MDW7971135.1 AAA family ATPase [Nitrososphaerota archaeon]
MAFIAAHELEAAAIKYAKEATRLDQQGSKGLAITYYQKAIDAFLKLVNLYPNYELNKIYIQRATMYQERIRVLRGEISESMNEQTEGRPISEQNSKQASYEDLLLIEKPNVKWDDVAGLDDVKRAIRESIVYPSKRPDLFPLGFPRGILLYGPPGCGKTLIAAAVATEIDAAFFSVDAASIMSKWLGEAEKNVARLFKSAREASIKQGSAIIFIDEIDSLLGVRYNEVGGEVRVRNQFLKEMDGIMDKGKSWSLYVIGATNKPWTLDWGFIRRFQKRIYVPVPDFETRLRIYQFYTQKLVMENVDLKELARISEGYSGSDIRDVCQAVQLVVVSELFESGKYLDKSSKPRPITMDDFKHVISQRRPSITQDMIKAYELWAENFKAI